MEKSSLSSEPNRKFKRSPCVIEDAAAAQVGLSHLASPSTKCLSSHPHASAPPSLSASPKKDVVSAFQRFWVVKIC